jgi:malate synthase
MGVEFLGPSSGGAWDAEVAEILSPQALSFVAGLQRHFGAVREKLLEKRAQHQRRLDQGARPGFPAETAGQRDADWKVAPLPEDLLDRRVEITGPVERKMIINALNSDASVFMADFEDSLSPTWNNVVEGQVHLRDAVRRTIELEQNGKHYRLADQTAVLMVRPRGWHLVEEHVRVDGKPVSASLFDFGLFFFHNARELIARGSGPYFYLPKLENYLEARLWNEVFLYAQAELGIRRGTIKATVLIETILAAFHMDEILYELREHSAGLNCGRWDYIFSFIKKFSADAACVLPDRGLVGMSEHFLHSYSLELIRTCHRRGAHAMGGMAAQIPIKDDPVRNAAALEKVRQDKLREATDGHDGTWVAHPGLVAVAREVFDREMPEANQIASKPRDDALVTAEDLLRVPVGPITEAGVRLNVSVGIQYLAAWLCGSGCVPLNDLMEDAATAEISRAQLWQWLRHGVTLDDGRRFDRELLSTILEEELSAIRIRIGEMRFGKGRFHLARRIFEELVHADPFPEFLTLPAYHQIISPRETPCKTSAQTRTAS